MTGCVRSVCVYCGSSRNPKSIYVEACQKFGEILAQNQVRLIYGGGDVGLMGVIAQSCLDAGGQVTGVMTDFLMHYEGIPNNLTELIIVPSMHERKQKMFELSDGFVAFPGGLGTLEEVFEVMTWRQVGLHSKPIVFASIDDYWSILVEKLIPHMAEERFVRQTDRHLFSTVIDVENILTTLEREPHENKDFVSKWG